MALRTIGPRVKPIGPRVKPLPQVSDDHYRAPEHRAWSKAVIRRAGFQCEDCGRDNTRLFADHITELRDGGAALDPANGRARCGACHGKKTMKARAARLTT